MKHDFFVPVVDTDSITICKKDGGEFTQDEIDSLTEEINSLTEELISWEYEFYVEKMVVIKSKNYIIYDPKNIKKPMTVKGSALKATQKEPALKEFINSIIDIILKYKDVSEMHEACRNLYSQYIVEIMNISDIRRWASKKTITDKILKNERTNEAKVREALVGSDYVEGDKVFLYFKEDGNLSLVERFNNDHDKETLLKKLYMTTQTFETILPVDDLFTNYGLKKKYKILANSLDNSNSGMVG